MFKGKKKHVLSCGLCFPVDGYRATCGSPRKHQKLYFYCGAICAAPFFQPFRFPLFKFSTFFFLFSKFNHGWWRTLSCFLINWSSVLCRTSGLAKGSWIQLGFQYFSEVLNFNHALQTQIFSWHSGKTLCPLLCIPWYPKNRLLLQQLIREVPPDLWSSNITEHRVVREEEIIHIELRVKFIFFRLQLFLHQTHRMIVLWLLETEGLLLQANTSRRGLTCFDARN